MRIVMIVGVCLLGGCVRISTLGPHLHIAEGFRPVTVVIDKANDFCTDANQTAIIRQYRETDGFQYPSRVEFICTSEPR
jgi:hypothetical protein